jgi:hypothetical protein
VYTDCRGGSAGVAQEMVAGWLGLIYRLLVREHWREAFFSESND